MKRSARAQQRHGGDPTILVPCLTVDDVQEALTNVIDPELGLDFVELGLIYER